LLKAVLITRECATDTPMSWYGMRSASQQCQLSSFVPISYSCAIADVPYMLIS